MLRAHDERMSNMAQHHSASVFAAQPGRNDRTTVQPQGATENVNRFNRRGSRGGWEGRYTHQDPQRIATNFITT